MVQDPTYGFDEGLRVQLERAGFSLNALPWEGPRPQQGVREQDDAQGRIYEAMAKVQEILDAMPQGTAQRSMLEGQREELASLMRDAVAGRSVDPSRLERVLANVQSAVSVAETTGAQQASVRFALQGEGYSREAMAAMHYEYYENDPVYRMQVDAIMERLDGHVETLDRVDASYRRIQDSLGIDLGEEHEAEGRRRRQALAEAQTPMERASATAEVASLEVAEGEITAAEIRARIEASTDPAERAALEGQLAEVEAGIDASRAAFDGGLAAYQAGAAALRAKMEADLRRQGVSEEEIERRLSAHDTTTAAVVVHLEELYARDQAAAMEAVAGREEAQARLADQGAIAPADAVSLEVLHARGSAGTIDAEMSLELSVPELSEETPIVDGLTRTSADFGFQLARNDSLEEVLPSSSDVPLSPAGDGDVFAALAMALPPAGPAPLAPASAAESTVTPAVMVAEDVPQTEALEAAAPATPVVPSTSRSSQIA